MSLNRVPQGFIDDVLSRVDIVDVIERYVPLKKAGQNYMACCPFHNEKSPSFTVSPTKQFYHCFGCGAHGSALGFLIEHSGLRFMEALRQLAGDVGLEVPEVSPGDVRDDARLQAKEKTVAILSGVAEHYARLLRTSVEAVGFAKSLGMNGRAAANFRVGFDDGDLSALMRAGGCDLAGLVDAGLVSFGGDGVAEPLLAGCLVIPAVDARGNVCGFAGVSLDPSKKAVIVSGRSLVGDPCGMVFGLPHARKLVDDGGPLLVVENPLEVVVLSGHGVPSVACPSGDKGVGARVLDQILRVCEYVVLCDLPGEHARVRRARSFESACEAMKPSSRIGFMDGLFVGDLDKGVGDFFTAASACVSLGRDVLMEQVRAAALPLSSALKVRAERLKETLSTEEARGEIERLLSKLSQAPMFQQIMVREIGTGVGMSFPSLQELSPSRPEVPFAHQQYVVGSSLPVLASSREQVVAFSLLCSLCPEGALSVPALVVDDACGLISAWFDLLPVDQVERRAALDRLPVSLRPVVVDALDRTDRLFELFDPDAVKREVDGLVAYFERHAAERVTSQSIKALLDED